jgi:hypothetical protein
MVIEYRTYSGRSDYPYRVLRTYENVAIVCTNSGVTYLRGIKYNLPSCPQQFLIAAIRLAPGEYLEVVDDTRD